jgi:protein SCO1/2
VEVAAAPPRPNNADSANSANNPDSAKSAVRPSAQGGAMPSASSTRWGRDYFPNVELITHQGHKVRFFDDLIKDKVVVIDFIFTTCSSACPLETARLVEVQRALGDRVGRDVFMYSISIDPENDSPSVLARYAEKFKVRPGWLFLTGKPKDIQLLGKKLGVFIQGTGPNSDHSLEIVVGNQATGQWMKRSPFETPAYLAAQIGSWLSNWAERDPNQNDYADAPRLRAMSEGESLFRGRCAPCHTIGQGELPREEFGPRPGPDLLGVTERHDVPWIERWIRDPEALLRSRDPEALALFARYDSVPMPNLQLGEPQTQAVIEYLKLENQRLRGEPGIR